MELVFKGESTCIKIKENLLAILNLCASYSIGSNKKYDQITATTKAVYDFQLEYYQGHFYSTNTACYMVTYNKDDNSEEMKELQDSSTRTEQRVSSNTAVQITIGSAGMVQVFGITNRENSYLLREW